MKSLKYLSLGLALTTSGGFAAAPQDGLYFGGLLGASITPSTKMFLQTPEPSLLTTATVKHGISANAGFELGYRLCNVRLAGELALNYSPYSSLNAFGLTIKNKKSTNADGQPNPKISGSSELIGGLFNAYYDFYDEEDDPSFIPYLGLGLGYGYTRNHLKLSNVDIPDVDSPLTSSVNYNKGAPLGQIVAGLSYYYSDNTAINFDYRYLTTSSIKSNYKLADNEIAKVNLGRMQAHTLNLGINYTFDD